MIERSVLDTGTRYRLLKLLEANPEASQRAIARELGVSLGKVNYCLRALMDKGLVKACNFRNSENKLAYLYVLTPKGVAEKTRLTVEFLRIKLAEAEALEQEIATLREEAARLGRERPESCA
jgi:EPS-associated MarR family transcriptional regulator